MPQRTGAQACPSHSTAPPGRPRGPPPVQPPDKSCDVLLTDDTLDAFGSYLDRRERATLTEQALKLIDENISKRAHRTHVFARLRNDIVESPHFALESPVERARMRVELPVQRHGGFDRVCVEVAGNVPVLPRDVLAIDEPPFDPQLSEKKQRVLVVGLVQADEIESRRGPPVPAPDVSRRPAHP